MLFNLRIFKKLVKEAYNGGGLIVGKKEEEYILCGGIWMVRIKEEAFDKEYKAAVIEHIGDLPQDGELIRKSKSAGESEVSEAGRKKLMLEDIEQACYPADPTNVYIDMAEGLCRVMQCQDKNVLIKEELAALVEEVKGEGMKGPFCNPEEEFKLYWHNSKCKYAACIIDIRGAAKEQEILKRLQAVDLSRR